MRFNPVLFDRHLANMGQDTLWRRSYSCACVNPASGQADPRHTLCAGKGRIWDAPLACVVGVANQATQAKWAAFGQYAMGDMVLVIPQASAMYDAGRMDRITALNASDVFSQPLVRAAPTEKLHFKPRSITRAFGLDPVTRQVVEFDLPTVGASGVPQWDPDAPQPLPGATYSLSGTRYNEYYLFENFPSDRNAHSGMRLPRRVVARQWDLFSR